MIFSSEDVLRVILAVVAGGLIGVEREFRDKAAGFRTLIFICVGAALFTIFSQRLGVDDSPTRIAANIVTGVGFLGAGVIMRDAGRVTGLTTASTIWLTAAMGLGLGGGHYLLVGASLGITLVVLWGFPLVEAWIDNVRHERTYEVTCALGEERLRRLRAMLLECGAVVRAEKIAKFGPDMRLSVSVSGSPACHERLMARLLEDPEIKELQY
jgi:putative Mg2+ transporter-C (MgtC) family protein